MNTKITLEQMNVVVAGHVDHGKSTLIGRLLVDTDTLPEGKLAAVKASCERNARPFEYAFLLDALKDEQAQGITIDTARCFFQTAKRRYIIIDAPGHIEFLKNMITGAARAEAAFILIDAKEGIQENSRRHGYMVSMLGIRQVVVLVNKMDLVGYDEKVFNDIRSEYIKFLEKLNIHPAAFIPISAFEGVNIVKSSEHTPWFKGAAVLEQLDSFNKLNEREELPFRLPLQDVYKFTGEGDDRRLFAGTVETGSINEGDSVVFLPSGKRSKVKSIERFNAPYRSDARAGEAVGFTLATQVYAKPGEMIVKDGDTLPSVGVRFRANIFWMGLAPMIKGKKYKIKLGAASAQGELVDVRSVIDASDLTSVQNKQQIDRHDVAECVIETARPLAFDLIDQIKFTGRFVIVDNYEISGAGIILENLKDEPSILQMHVDSRESAWARSPISREARITAYGHGAKFVMITGSDPRELDATAEALEKVLFGRSFKVYYLRTANALSGIESDIRQDHDFTDEHIRRLGELARILTDAGQIFIAALYGADDVDLDVLKTLNSPSEILVVNIGEKLFEKTQPDLLLSSSAELKERVDQLCDLLKRKDVILDYQI